MQRWIAAALAALLVLSGVFVLRRCVARRPESEPASGTSVQTAEPETDTSEVRAVWISYLELAVRDEANPTADTFRSKIGGMFQTLQDCGIDTVFLHVRAFADAFYRSSVFPFSAYLTGTQGGDPGYDPLAIACAEAARRGIAVHAWINPFRVCASVRDWDAVSPDNPAKRFLSDDDPDNDHCVVRTAGGVYFDPAAADVQALILRGVEEILEQYPVAGVHIDDYFYPAQDGTIDETEYAAYRASGGTDSLADWRRGAVSAWMRDLYSTVKRYGGGKVFSVSPAVGIGANRDRLYADVERWCGESGFCDWIIPQLYVGFEHETVPFADAAAQWDALCTCRDVKLLFGLAAYKCGREDTAAGTGRAEWVENCDILSRQITHSRTHTHAKGFVLFSFSYLFGENMTDNSNSEQHFVISVL